MRYVVFGECAANCVGINRHARVATFASPFCETSGPPKQHQKSPASQETGLFLSILGGNLFDHGPNQFALDEIGMV